MDSDEENERKRSFNCLVEAFSSFSFDEVVSAYEAAEGDANKAAVILSAELMGVGEVGDGVKQEGEKSAKGGRRKKAVTASTGMVSSVLGKGYVWTGSRRNGFIEPREVKEDQVGREEAEEFLFSMLGVECQLDFGVIRDVFCMSYLLIFLSTCDGFLLFWLMVYTWIVILKPWGRLGSRLVMFTFGNTYLLCVISIMITRGTSGWKLVMRVNGLTTVSLGGPLSIPYLMLATLDLLPD